MNHTEEALQWYVKELFRWNRKVNLVSRQRSLKEIWQDLQEMKHLASWLPSEGGWAEVGAGGGLLALPLALLRPDLWSVWLEVRTRRYAFLSHVVRTLRLSNVQVLQESVETWDPAQRPNQIWVRALPRGPWHTLRKRAEELLAPGGAIIRVVSREDLVRDADQVHRAGRFWVAMYFQKGS